MPPGSIDERQREILTAVVETFISTGEPVGSRTLARSNREGLSPATIRNVMADLSDAGFLEQPHTSDQAFVHSYLGLRKSVALQKLKMRKLCKRGQPCRQGLIYITRQ